VRVNLIYEVYKMKESKIKKKNTFLKKLFLKLSRRLGYEVMDQSDLTLQDLDGSNSKSSLSKLGVNSLTLPMGTVNITRPVKSLDIILRTCASVKMLTQSKERIFEKEKSEYTLRCLKSIVNSIKFSENELKKIKIKLTIIDFNSDQSIIDKFEAILKNNFFSEFVGTFVLVFGIFFIASPIISIDGIETINYGIGSLVLFGLVGLVAGPNLKNFDPDA